MLVAVLPRDGVHGYCSSIVGIPDSAPGPPLRAVRQLALSPCAPFGVARLGACGLVLLFGGFRALDIGPWGCSYRHVLCSFAGVRRPRALSCHSHRLVLDRPSLSLPFQPRSQSLHHHRLARRRLHVQFRGFAFTASSACLAWLPRCRWSELYAPRTRLSSTLARAARRPDDRHPITRAHARACTGVHGGLQGGWQPAAGRTRLACGLTPVRI